MTSEILLLKPRQTNDVILGLLVICKLWKCFLFVDFRYSDEQIPGVLYASVNPEYMTSTDGM